MDASNGEARRRSPEKKRESILEAAIAVFSRGGYEASSMDSVAEEAGASKRTVYNYFPSKEILLEAIAERFADEMRELKGFAYDPAESLEAQLGRFVDAEIAVVADERWMGMVRLLVSAFVRSPGLAGAAVSRNRESGDPLAAWVRAAVRDGRLTAPDPELAAAVLRSLLGGAFTWPAVYGAALDPDRREALKRELVAAFLCRYPPARPDGT